MLLKISKTTTAPKEIVDITEDVAKVVKESNIKDGVVIIYSPHTTCAVTVNENTDPGLKTDILGTLSSLFPPNHPKYVHRGENADAHIQTAMVGTSETVIVEDRALLLGRWQSIYLCEFDGPRDRDLHLKIIAG